MRHLRLTFVLILLALLALATRTSAQTADARVETGVQFSRLGLLYDDKVPAVIANGVGASLDVNITRRIALEAQINWFPTDAPPGFTLGGRTVQFTPGIRGTFVRRRRFSVYGVELPGLLHFSHAVAGYKDGEPALGGVTRLGVLSGFGLEWYSAKRWTARVEVAGWSYVSPGAVIDRSPPGPNGGVLVVTAPSITQNPWQITAGLGVRPGALETPRAEDTVAGSWEFGPLFGEGFFTGAFTDWEDSETQVGRNTTLGVFAARRVWKGIDVDVAADMRTRRDEIRSPSTGGRTMRAFAGVKAGLRRDRYGIFFKLKPGVVSHSGTIASIDFIARSETLRRTNLFAVDYGGVVERYIGRHFVVRFDVSDVLTRFRETTIAFNGADQVQPAQDTEDRIQVAAGFGLRF